MKRISIVFLFASLGAAAFSQEPASLGKKVKTAAEAFKNVQVLKDIPADEWFPTMEFFAGSLGVTCEHCHKSFFEVDEDSPDKLKARQMIRMVNDINHKNFNSQTVVTCNTCHRGNLKPQASPEPNVEHWMRPAEKGEPLPDASDLVRRYRSAVGIGAVQTLHSQAATLRLESYNGEGPAKQSSIELLVDSNDKVRVVDNQGGSTTIFVKNGKEAWIKNQKGWHAMDEDDLSVMTDRVANLDLDQVGEQTSLQTLFKDRVDGRPAFVVEATKNGGKRWFYFDASTGLLLRTRIFMPTIYADTADDIEFADYRKTEGFQIPFTIRFLNPGGAGLTIRRMITRKLNVATTENDFSKAGQ